MLDAVANVFLNIFSRWADRPIVRVNVKHLEYDLIRNDPDSALVIISPYPSRYYAEVEFSHRGKSTTIKQLKLIINNELSIEAAGFSPIKLEHGDYRKEIMSFPIEESQVITQGTFEIQAFDAFGKLYRRKGFFPIL
jgi:hypothetical protein